MWSFYAEKISIFSEKMRFKKYIGMGLTFLIVVKKCLI